MNNDLEKLTHELEKIGLNKERLLHDESSDDRFAHATSTGTSPIAQLTRVLSQVQAVGNQVGVDAQIQSGD